ncbi:MAG: protein kinase, partial [Planctomycetota bacterium]
MDSNRPRPAGPGDPGGDGPGDAPPPPGDLPASNRIGPYFVESVMGRDDVEVLCLARDTARDERYVTLRLLPLVMIRNAPAMDVLRDFAERAAAVRHPNLDEFLGLDRDPSRDDLVFLVSGYVTGRRLADLVAEAPEGLPVDDVLHWADQLADAIDHLHEHKLRHGAVNPHRVVIETSGRVRLTGATVWAETRRLFSELTGRVVGADPDYASPQQAAGIASAAFF